MALKDAIKNGKLAYPNRLVNVSNAPEGTRPNDTSIEPISALYYEEIGKYASNVFDAEIQGLNGDDWYAWTSVRLRSSDVINPTTGDHLDNTWQKILIIDRKIDYVPIGAYVKYNGAIWIVFNPSDVAATSGTAIVERCNTTYNQYDYYNNVIKTPMAYAKGLELAGAPYYSEYMALPSGYTHVTLQLNDNTKEIHNNTRLILGNTAYAFHGLVNFSNEYTMDDNSCHIIRSDIRTTEVIPDDDMENRIASGFSQKLTIGIVANQSMGINSVQGLKIRAYRNGERILPDTEHPFDYTVVSSDEEVIKIEKHEDGEYYAHAYSLGTAILTATLVQNPNISTQFEMEVKESIDNLEPEVVEHQKVVEFIGDFPDVMSVFDTKSITASVTVNGEILDDEVFFSFTGANINSYSAEVNGHTVVITAYVPDTVPLTITAYSGDLSVIRNIQIMGF